MTACKKQQCIVCVIQNNISKEIVSVESECDKSTSFLSGYVDGVQYSYKDSTHIDVICGYDQ
ncbi:MAG: hypothetical protein MI810_25320 [Flavobacteriales bacterium]|nr:hypothetical protein [Flavobacteriales bacterium]